MPYNRRTALFSILCSQEGVLSQHGRSSVQERQVNDMRKLKMNGLASWILIGITIIVLAYNSIAVHVIARNDIHHLQIAIAELKTLVLDHVINHE